MPTASTDFGLDRLGRLLNMGMKRVYWRHDVDFDPACAVAMAKVEKHIGIKATYFLRVDEEEYSKEDMAALADVLSEMGHTIGTHVSLGLPRSALVESARLAGVVAGAFRVAQELFPAMSRRVSLHAPPRSALWRSIEGFEHAGAACWKGYYLSDSRGVFKESPEAFMLLDAPIQINLHPEWWFLSSSDRKKLFQQEAKKP